LRTIIAREVTKGFDGFLPRVVDLETKAASLAPPREGVDGAPGPPGPPGPPGELTVALRFVTPYADGVDYYEGDFVALGASVYRCEKPTTIKPGTVSRNAHGEVRGPQGKDFWTLVDGRGRDV
jgi:hypothetical protein